MLGRPRSFTDAQYRWLWQKRLEGYSYKDMCAAVYSSTNGLKYNFVRLGLCKKRKDLPPIDWEEFYALGGVDE